LSVNTSSRQGSREGLAGEMLLVESGADGRVGFLQWELELVAYSALDREGTPGTRQGGAEQGPSKYRFLSQVFWGTTSSPDERQWGLSSLSH